MGRSECRSGLPYISGCRMMMARIDGKLMARKSFWRRYGIHPGAGWRRRESALRGDVPGPQGTAALSRHVQQPAEGGPGLAAGRGEGRPELLRRARPRPPGLPRLRREDMAAEPRA